jgi:hypothetical protein
MLGRALRIWYLTNFEYVDEFAHRFHVTNMPVFPQREQASQMSYNIRANRRVAQIVALACGC